MAPKRDRGTSFFSPSKANKKARSGLSEDDADRALDSEVMTKMLNEQAKNFAAKHPEEAHNLISRMTITAMGKAVKRNNKGITTVSLLLTFATEHDKDRFQNIAKDC